MKSLILTAFLPSLISSHDFCDLDTYLHTDNHQVEKFKSFKKLRDYPSSISEY